MNYFKHYSKLIRKSQSRTQPDVYCEKHHVFPTSIFGKNNLIAVLTAKEHYIAHLLLYKICLKRYGTEHRYTIKMARAWWMMTMSSNLHSRHTSRSFASARQAMAESFKGDKNPSKNPGIGDKISKAKSGVAREDMKGKAYFGASAAVVKAGIAKMVEKKTGMVIDYPKDRKSAPCSADKAEKIRQTRLKAEGRFIDMTDNEFENWIGNQSLFNKKGGRNSNVTRALKWRKISVDIYYGV